MNLSRNYSEWEGETAPGTQAVVVPKLNASNPLGQQNFKKVAWLIDWHTSFSGSLSEFMTSKDKSPEETNSFSNGDLEHALNIWTQIVDGVTLFNRLAIELHSSSFYRVATFISGGENPFTLHGFQRENQTVNKLTDWSQLELPRIEKDGNPVTALGQIFLELGKQTNKDDQPLPPLTQASTFFPSLNWVRLRLSDTEPWNSDGSGQDIRNRLLEALKESPQLQEHLLAEPKKTLHINIIKINPYDTEENIFDENIGDLLTISVYHFSASNLHDSFTQFTFNHQNLKTINLLGLPFKDSEDNDDTSEGLTMVIRSPMCQHANPFTCHSLQYTANKNPQLGQLPSTCAYLISPLDIYNSQSQSLGKTLSEGYFYPFYSLPDNHSMNSEDIASKCSHILRVVAGKYYSITVDIDLSYQDKVDETPTELPSQEQAFHEYFKKHIVLPNVRSLEDNTQTSQPGVVLLNPAHSRTLDGTRVLSPGLASHSLIPSLPKMAVETGWLAHILSFSEGDDAYKSKVFSSALISKIKKIFTGESPPDVNSLKQHLDILCHSNVDHTPHTLSKSHQMMFLTGIRELIRVWSDVKPISSSFLQDALNDVQKRRVNLSTSSLQPNTNPSFRPNPIDQNVRPGFYSPQHRPSSPFSSTPRGPSFSGPNQSIRPPGSSWNRPPIKPSTKPQPMVPYLRPEFFDVSSHQTSWLSKLGPPDSLLHRYWASQQDSNISLQTPQLRKKTDFEARQL